MWPQYIIRVYVCLLFENAKYYKGLGLNKYVNYYSAIHHCPVIGARESGRSSFYVFFKHEILRKYKFSSFRDLLDGSYYSEKNLFTYYPDLNRRYPDAACMFEGNMQLFFFGKMLVIIFEPVTNV